MLTLLKNADVYAPDPLGEVDILVADGRIAALEREAVRSLLDRRFGAASPA